MNIKQICCIALSLLSVAISGLALCRASGTMSIYAAEHDADLAGSYGIEISCRFDDQEKTDHSRKDYQANSFLLTDEATGYYAQAEYSKKAGGYVVSGFTGDKAAAAVFRCGQDRETPGKLAILGLREGTYILTQEETAEGYWVLRDSVAFSFSANRSVVTLPGYTIDNQCRNAALYIVNAARYDLPQLYPTPWENFIHDGFAVGAVAVWLGIAVLAAVLIIREKKKNSQGHSGENQT